MKKIFTLFFFASLATFVNAQIYVNDDASGGNDGSSWANAFTSFSSALDVSNPGDEIWVAVGIYKPPSPAMNPDTAFMITQDLSIYGGFNGSETSLDARDPAANRTIFSGDQNSDDVPSDFTENKFDNNRHVFFVVDTVEETSTIFDGIFVQGGYTAPESGAGDSRRGGGILTYGNVIINDCVIRQNWGYFGGGVYPRGGDGSSISNCTFENNSGQDGGAMYITSVDLTITDCIYEGNSADDDGGGIFNNASSGTILRNCEFIENLCGDDGAGMVNSGDAQIYDCEFIGNLSSEDAGALYNPTSSSIVRNCLFEANDADGRGAAVYNISSNAVFDNCEFIDNTNFNGQGTFCNNIFSDVFDTVLVEVVNCTFDGNTTDSGGGIASFGRFNNCAVSKCLFSNNTCSSVGGGIYQASGSFLAIDSCGFIGNEGSSGGAINSFGDNCTISVTNSALEMNSASGFGGGMNLSGDGVENDTISLKEVTISNCLIRGNLAATQGGGINLNNVNSTISSTLVAENINTDAAAIGSGISINSGDTTRVFTSILNSTIADNSGSIFAGISHFTGEVDGFSELTMQNTILANEQGGDNYSIEAGTPTAISNGGNLITDDTADDWLNTINDLSNTAPGFLESGDHPFSIEVTSAAKDAGVADNAPASDILGNPRVGTVDIGAYENQIVVSNKNYLLEDNSLQIFPNPIQNETVIFVLRGDMGQKISYQITDVKGRVVASSNISKDTKVQSYRVDANQLIQGLYSLTVTDGQKASMKKFVKL